ncbi:MAG: hypothetical protein INE97_03380, partial [Phenylobacterium sp.]|nr:hypothetical protein [Phenylobacterium sp.]
GVKTGGRTKGVPNKATKALKDMILGALDDAGGQDYLRRQSIENPTAFLTLIGKVLPTTINADVKGEVGVVIRRFTPEPNGD